MNTGITSVARLAEDQVRTALAAADQAPGRPAWRFECTATTIELHEKGDSTDPGHAARVLACGGALLNLRLAVQAVGVYADVRLAPDPNRPTLLAALRPEHERLATTWDRRLAHMIGHRIIIQAPGQPVGALRELRKAADVEQAWLARLSTTQLANVGVPMLDSRLVLVIGSLQDDVRSLLHAGQAVQRVALTAATLGFVTTPLGEPLATPAARTRLRALIGGALSPHAVLAVG
ncbi:MAG TPA: hypothetical protein VFW65_13620 [Pseudonocardiaceae bacterium]|nr:hypothetical protein [Pseudonocardiaceae bacterium]